MPQPFFPLRWAVSAPAAPTAIERLVAVHIQIDAWDPVAGAPVTLYAGSHDDADVCHTGGQTWWPTIAKLPTLRYDLFDGAFAGQITAPSSSLTLRTEPWRDFGRYSFPDARFQLWTGKPDAFGGTWTLRFDGRVKAQPQIVDGAAEIDFAVDDAWLDKPLLATYAGTSGAEGPIAMKGQAKPLALGQPLYVSGKLIDSLNSVFQVSGYGPVTGIDVALEKLNRFSPSIGDFASYAALIAATIPAGMWATAKAVGMARFGAPPSGQISFLVRGDAAGPNGWARTPGQIIRRIALLSGGAGKIDDASLDALDAAAPYPISVYLDAQTTARQLIQGIAASVNAVAGVSWLGQLFVASVGLGAPTLTLAADGSSLPPVKSVTQIDIGAPWQKLTLGAERTWTVHALTDIAFTATLLPLGEYDPDTTYREGNIVTLPDGSSWLYEATTPTKGNPPAADSAFWASQDPATEVDWSTGVIGAGKPQDNADVTAQSQIVVTRPGDVTINADATATIGAGQLPKTLSMTVHRGATDITASDTVSYALANVSTNLAAAGTLAIDTVAGSAMKGQVKLASPLPGSGQFDIIATVGGVAQPAETVKVILAVASAPTGGGAGGGAGSIDGFACFSTTFVAAITFTGLAVASGQAIHALAHSDYDRGGGTPGGTKVSGKWQYATAGTGFASPTDFAAPVAGSTAIFDSRGLATQTGSITVNQTAAPAAGSYDVRFVVAGSNALNCAFSNSTISAGVS